MAFFVRWYRIRTVNVNVNIVVAGAIALGITVLAMEGLHHFFNLQNKYLIGGLTFLVDLIADVVVYYALHWIANHWPKKDLRFLSPAYAHLSYFHDATLVQFERAILSPILYTIALGLQNVLLHRNYSIGAATAIGFAAGIGTSRVLHTFWLVRQERRARNRLKTAPAGVQPAASAPPAPAPERRIGGDAA